MQGGLLLPVAQIYISGIINQHFRQLFPAALGGEVQGRGALGGGQVHQSGAPVQELLGQEHLAPGSRQVQQSQALVIPRVIRWV